MGIYCLIQNSAFINGFNPCQYQTFVLHCFKKFNLLPFICSCLRHKAIVKKQNKTKQAHES